MLDVGYAEVGPSNGLPVILLHGWPYDIHAFADVAPLLGSAGYRVIVPHLRGYGTTRFRSTDTMRNGQQSVVAVDIVALMDALKIPRAIFAGFRPDRDEAVRLVAHFNDQLRKEGWTIVEQEIVSNESMYQRIMEASDVSPCWALARAPGVSNSTSRCLAQSFAAAFDETVLVSW
jgi:hypothetical protein